MPIARFVAVSLLTSSIVGVLVAGFSPLSALGRHHRHSSPRCIICRFEMARVAAQDGQSSSFLLQDFKTASGEILNPYKVLHICRDAGVSEIKHSYRALSRRYHPDTMRHRTILPGSCNNLDEVRDQWERIKLSYEILKNPKMRKRYDRHEFLADPLAAAQRAAANAAWNGIKGVGQIVGKSIFEASSFAFQQIKEMQLTQEKAMKNGFEVAKEDVTTTNAEVDTIKVNVVWGKPWVHSHAHLFARDVAAAWNMVFVNRHASKAIVLPDGNKNSDLTTERATQVGKSIQKPQVKFHGVNEERGPGGTVEDVLNQMGAMISYRLKEFQGLVDIV